MPRIYPELWILRHGQTEWNAQARFQGQLDSALTPDGVAQARAQNAILRAVLPDHPLAWITSTAPRARRTAEIAARGLALDGPMRLEPRLQELHFGDWQGLTRREIEAGWPDLIAGAEPELWQFHAPGGETLDRLVARCGAVLDALDGPTVIVTHGITSRVLRCVVLGRDPARLTELPGGQGVVHHLSGGVARMLEA